MNGKLIPVFVLTALMSCSQPPVKEQGPRPVKLEEVTSLDMVEKSFSGVVSPDQFSDLAFKMSGPLISLNVEEGQKVRTGQIVAEIDHRISNGIMKPKRLLSRQHRHSCNVQKDFWLNRQSLNRSMNRQKLLIPMHRQHSRTHRTHWSRLSCVLLSMASSKRNM